MTQFPGAPRELHERAPEFDIILSSAEESVGLNFSNSKGESVMAIRSNPMPNASTKIAQGETKYSDDTAPFTTVAQEDWTGGGGNEYFDEDRTRFFTARGMDTLHASQLIPGPMPIYSGVHGYTVSNFPVDVGTPYQMIKFGDHTSRRGIALRFRMPFTITDADEVKFFLRRNGLPTDTLYIEIYTDVAGSIGTEVTNYTYTHILTPGDEEPDSKLNEHAGGVVGIPLGVPANLTAASWYWIIIRRTTPMDPNNNYSILCVDTPWILIDDVANPATACKWVSAPAGTPVLGTDIGSFLVFTASKLTSQMEWTYFRFRGCLFGVAWDRSTGTNRLFINGDFGVVSTASETGFTDSTKSGVWPHGCFQGAAVQIMAGKNADSRKAWARLSGYGNNTVGGCSVVYGDWTVIPDTTSEYAILGANYWMPITSGVPAGFTSKRVKDVLSVNNVVYFAMGKDNDIIRMRYNNVAGTWTPEWVTETGNRADFLEAVIQDGVTYIWSGVNEGYYKATVKKATGIWGGDSGTIGNLSFGSAINTFPLEDRITGLQAYGDPETLWVLKEGSVGYMYDDKFYTIPLKEMRPTADWRNGRASAVHNVYLYFSFLNSLERYYKSNLDDIGPNRNNGMPWEIQGTIQGLEGFPGILYAAIDGNRYPTVWAYNQIGWHELVRLGYGEYIDGLCFQSVPPPDYPELLWLEADTPCCIHVSSSTMNPWYTTRYMFVPEGELITSWIDTGLRDREKIFAQVSLYTEGLLENYSWIEAYYQTDEGGASTARLSTWLPIRSNNQFTQTPSETHQIVVEGLHPTARRMRFKLVFKHRNSTGVTGQTAIRPRVKAFTVDTVVRLPIRWMYSFNFRIDSFEEGPTQDIINDVAGVVKKLQDWSQNNTPLMIESISETIHGVRGYLDSFSWQPINVQPDTKDELVIGNAVFVALSDLITDEEFREVPIGRRRP